MRDNQAKLLDAWSPPNGAGEPVGLIATTYTFDGVFFEEECLGRFLSIQSNVHSDGPFYLIELEEKLAGLECISLLVDSNHCSGSRNLRWDLIPARVTKGGVFHPKITILHWAQVIRLIIGSANITENGYRENQETFAYVDFSNDSKIPARILTEVLDFLSIAINDLVGQRERPDADRYRNLILRIRSTLETWDNVEEASNSNELQIHTQFIYPGSKSLFDDLKKIWKEYCRGVPRQAIVTSPFFNPPEDKDNLPARKIWDVLSQTGPVQVTYNAPVDDFSSNEESIVIEAPSSLMKSAPRSRKNATVDFQTIHNMVQLDSQQNIRPFHFKSICIKNQESMAYLIGSSNFTTSGTGLKTTSNYEANLIFSIRKKNKQYQALEKSRIKGNPIQGDYTFQKESRINDDETGSDEYLPLPLFFDSAQFVHDKVNKLVLTFSGEPLPQFVILTIDQEKFLDEKQWQKESRSSSITINWGERSLPSGILVSWKNAGGYAFWPVIVDDRNSLPPPADLKNLPLELLIKIITSSRPMHQIVGNWLAKKDKMKDPDRYEMMDVTDSHRRVDTTSFLLQRTRKISYALYGLRQRLEKPVYTMESLNWRLHGPIGVIVISNAIIQEAGKDNQSRSNDEIAFLLTEIALELSRIQYIEKSNSLSNKEVIGEIRKVIHELHKLARPYTKGLDSEMKNYIKKAFKTAGK